MLIGFSLGITSAYASAQPPAMSNIQSVSRIDSETVLQGYNKLGNYNAKFTEISELQVDSSDNLKITNQISYNTSEYQGTVRYFIRKDTRDIYFSEDEGVIPLQKTDLYVGPEIANAQIDSTTHEMNIIAHTMNDTIHLPELRFEYQQQEIESLGGGSVTLKVFNASSAFYFQG